VNKQIYAQATPVLDGIQTSKGPTGALPAQLLWYASSLASTRPVEARVQQQLWSFTINFGPQHPAAQPALHLVIELDGEVVE
jgi:hypothetical protein